MNDPTGGMPADDKQALGRVMGFDFGTVRLGIAISDEDRRIASPLENYRRRDNAQDAQHLRQLVEELNVVQLVVGLPIHLDGRESEKSGQARKFGAWLSEVCGRPVDFFDERFTTVQANEALRLGKLSHKKRQQRRDMLAAQMLLAGYLDSGCRGLEHNQPIDDTPD